MNAETMFLHLGYVCVRKDRDLIIYQKNKFTIIFEPCRKSFACYEKKFMRVKPVFVVFGCYLAINQQMKELGWIK